MTVHVSASTTAEQSVRAKQFAETGYLVLPGFLPTELIARLKAEVDRWVDEGWRDRSIQCCLDPDATGPPELLEIDLPAHREVLCHPPLLELLAELVGAPVVFHHLHSDRHQETTASKPWHHDYEQRPQRARDFAMVHALHYLDGLDERTASLAILPGTHRQVLEKTALAEYAASPLPGEVLLENLPAGSTVVLHSALFHARRPRVAHTDAVRYLTDASYCQVGTQWPPVKPFWYQLLARAREYGMADPRWPELFEERHFSEYERPA